MPITPRIYGDIVTLTWSAEAVDELPPPMVVHEARSPEGTLAMRFEYPVDADPVPSLPPVGRGYEWTRVSY